MSSNTFFFLTVTFTILSILGQVSTNIYSPFFYDLAKMYNSHVEVVEQSVAIFLVAFSISQLVSGIVCDYINKQKLLLCGILAFCLGTVMIILADTESTFLFGRIIQGLGGGVGVSVSRGLSRQIFTEKQLNISLSLTNIAFAIAPAVAPMMGTLIGESFGTIAIFHVVLMMGVIALLLLSSILTAVEKYTPATSINVLSETLGLIKTSMMNILFIGMASGFLYGIVFSFITAAPSMVMEQFGLSKTMFSICSLFATFSFVLGSLINIRLVAIPALRKFKFSSLCIFMLSLIFLLLVAGLNLDGLVTTLGFSYAAFFFIGIAMPCSVTILLGFSETSAGFLAALTGFFHLAGAAIGAYAVTILTMDPVVSFSYVTFALSLTSLFTCLLYKKHNNTPRH
ncbi:MFS transporter [Alteromonas sp. KUL106]|uniref:MFS transporter n=1 Tax=Alteromonas sp. KUL106 TaxID=2480799 RepID=UPI0012E46C00|nr:MFS transporter [Alteromonas sp. KUL106]GFD67328.1 MFS transporter [Alteromonas sp. KUL106]GFD78099.1 MFS transporter [Tenacibaculum sp. KUL118]